MILLSFKESLTINFVKYFKIQRTLYWLFNSYTYLWTYFYALHMDFFYFLLIYYSVFAHSLSTCHIQQECVWETDKEENNNAALWS